VTAVPEPFQIFRCGNNAGAEGIEMDIPHEFQEIGFLLAEDGLVAVLEEMTRSPVAPVVRDGVSREKAPHHLRERRLSGFEEKMEVVRDKGESVTPGLRLIEDDAKTVQEEVTVVVVTEDDPPLDSSRYDVMQGVSGIYAGFTRHVVKAL